MNLTIDRNKLKCKHFLNIQTETIEYPTEEDYLFELATLIEKQEDNYNSSFAASWVKRKICNVLDIDEHIEMLKKLEKDDYIYTYKKGNKRQYPLYKFKKHPWTK